jgi:hypothetical protein
VSTDPVIVKGSHLTVTTWANGRTELKWDDEALLKDVQNAVLKYESNIPATSSKPAKKVAAKMTVDKKEPAKKTAAKKTTPKKTKK